ncbi:hypothetical protein F5Y09DRAFT_354502 [Xylaria sp. FL1042]|nr:hypothetical protein F5Y09DRAFT_354502 [Xylaria sp. FL1042]
MAGASKSRSTKQSGAKKTPQAASKAVPRPKNKGKGKAIATQPIDTNDDDENDDDDDRPEDQDDNEDEEQEQDDNAPSSSKAKTKKPKPKPTRKTKASGPNYLPKGLYHGEEPILDYLRGQGYEDPMWYGDILPLPIKRVPFTGGQVITTAAEKQKHENHYKSLNGLIPSTLITTGSSSPFSGDSQAAAVVGFGDSSIKGVERFLIFVDNHAPDAFAPLQRVLQQRLADQVSFDFHHNVDNATFFKYVLQTATSTYDDWYEAILDSQDYFGELPDEVRTDNQHSFYIAIVGACFVLANQHPQLFIEREGKDKGHFVRGVSLEDMMRCSIVMRHYLRRRRSGDYGTANKKSPNFNAAKVNLNATILYYQSDEAVAEAAGQTEEIKQQEEYSLGVAASLQLLHNSGLPQEFNLVEQHRYEQLCDDDKEEFCYKHIDALEKMRVAWFHSTNNNTQGKQLPYMSDETKSQLLTTLDKRVYNKREGFNPLKLLESTSDADHKEFARIQETITSAMEAADDQEPDFDLDDDYATGHWPAYRADLYNPLKPSGQFSSMAGLRKQRATDALEVYRGMSKEEKLKANYNILMDSFSGGNDSKDMSMETAMEITGIDYKTRYIDPDRKDPDARLHEHQIVDTAALIQKLTIYPYAGLLANACGTGKTATYMCTIAQIVKQQIERRRYQDAKKIPMEERQRFYPSIVFVPATLVKPTYDECRRLFRNLLSPCIYYGTRGDYNGDTAAQSTFIPAGELGTRMKTYNPHNPKSGRVLVITSYVTFKRRETVAIPKRRKQLSFDDRVFLGHHMCDSPSSVDRRSNSDRDLEKEDHDQDELDRRLLDDTDSSDSEGQDDDDKEIERRRNAANELLGDAEDTPTAQLDDEINEVEDAIGPVREGGRRKKGKGRLGDKRDQVYTIYEAKNDIHYNVIVCDEAHLLKNHKSAIHKSVKCLPRNSLLLVTATPMLNDTVDMLSLLLLVMPRSLASYTPTEYSYHTMYGEGEKLLLCDPCVDPRETGFVIRSDTVGLSKIIASVVEELEDGRGYDVESDEQDELSDFISVPGIPEDDERGECPILDKSDPEYEAKYESFRQHGRKWWQLQPCNARWALKEFGHSFDGARVLLKPILQQLCVKRGMQTPLQLPNGKIVRPGDALKGACFRVVHVQFTPEDQLHYNSIWNVWGKKLYKPEREDDGKPDKSRGVDVGVRGGGPGTNIFGESVAKINPKAVRQLTLPAFNIQNERLLTPRIKTVGLVKALETAQKKKTRTFQEGLASLESADGNSYRPELGVEEVLSLIQQHPKDGGANWVYELLKAGPEYLPLASRQHYIHFHAYRSPLLCTILRQVDTWIKEPKGKDGLPNRVVIMANMPWIQQEVALCLQMMGWEIGTIRSDHTVQERNNLIDKFNDPETDIQILVTSMDLSAYGLNLHKACCKGMVIQWPWNANHLLQILGRLPRIHQQRFVEWVILHMPGTVYDKMQTIVWSKYTKQLAVESKIPDAVTGMWADIAAHGLIHKLFNLPHNRWLWDKKAYSLDVVGIDGALDRNVRLSVFFERVAALLNNPTLTPPRDPDEAVDFHLLASRSPKDVIAAAWFWMNETEENAGREVPITYKWLVDHCDFYRIEKLDRLVKGKYLSDRIIDTMCLNGKPEFPNMDVQGEDLGDVCQALYSRPDAERRPPEEAGAIQNFIAKERVRQEDLKRKRDMEEDDGGVGPSTPSKKKRKKGDKNRKRNRQEIPNSSVTIEDDDDEVDDRN